MKSCVVGIDASRNRSGGAKHHLVGLLGAADPTPFGISKVHVWAYRALIEALPRAPWLVTHQPPALERSLLHQMWWQRFELSKELLENRCDILLSTDAGTIGVHEPSIVMSRDMLSYEPGEMSRYGFSRAWLRLWLLRHAQARSLRRARGAVFLTQYACETIQEFTGKLANVAIIPHGVGEKFRRSPRTDGWPGGPGGRVRCLYVSNAEMYKHPWHVVRAIAELRKRGYDAMLTLAGGGEGRPRMMIDEEIRRSDPRGEFVHWAGPVAHDRLPALLAESDLFIFASSCENMPNTLLEGMASGLPIACSDRGPMPEVLGEGGVYFNPEDPATIAAAVERLITDSSLRDAVMRVAKERSERFSWSRCARETWAFLRANVAT